MPAAAGTRPAGGTPEVSRSWQTVGQRGARPLCHSSRTVEWASSPPTRMAMSKSLGQPESFVGVDLSEARLDVCDQHGSGAGGGRGDRGSGVRPHARPGLGQARGCGGQPASGARLRPCCGAARQACPRAGRRPGPGGPTGSTPMRSPCTAHGYAPRQIWRAHPPIRRWPRWCCAAASSAPACTTTSR